MARYSHSKFLTFEQCKYKYKLCYIDKVKVDFPTTVEAFMGNLVHSALEKLFVDLKFNKLNSKQEILDFYKGLWSKKWSDDIIIVKKEFTAENYQKIGHDCIAKYYDHYYPFDQMIVLGIETQDMLTLPDGNKYYVRIDKLGRIGSTYFVCDYKTNSSMIEQFEADEDRQLGMYSIWVKDKFKDAKKVVLLWNMLKFDKEVVSQRSDEQIEKLKNNAVDLIKNIESCTEFTPNVSVFCNYCVYKSMCLFFDECAEKFKK